MEEEGSWVRILAKTYTGTSFSFAEVEAEADTSSIEKRRLLRDCYKIEIKLECFQTRDCRTAGNDNNAMMKVKRSNARGPSNQPSSSVWRHLPLL